MAIEAGRRSKGKPLPIKDLSRLREEFRIITGIHEAHNGIYRDLGLVLMLPACGQKMSHQVLLYR